METKKLESTKCNHCKGTGVAPANPKRSFGMSPREYRCPACNGKGIKTIK